MHKQLSILFFVFLPALLPAQTIDVELPYYAARDYYFCLLEGNRQDTIFRGALNSKGKATINLPENYRGVGRLSVKEYGKIWNIIINGNEDISICPSQSPRRGEEESSAVYSFENSFLSDALARQNKIIQDYYQAANQQQSQAQSFVLALPEVRLSGLEADYKAFRKEIADSPLYAARMVEILNCLSGMGSSFHVSQEEVLEEQRSFIVNKADFNDLYTSGFWQPVLEAWVQITSVNDSLLLSDARHMIDRCGNDIPIRREVTQAIIRMFSKYAKDNLLAELGTEYLTMPLNGQLAPQIVLADGSSFLPKSSLIVFYETGCGNCHYELEALKGKYRLLLDNNIRVISIAADVGEEVHEETSATLPWTDKLCDYKGFEGKNFIDYGIVGTPTYILTDSEGIVRGRYAQLRELFKD